ncbi:MAG: patatin-like phospholipase family protein [Candidatus Margulisbacteria bacterium]|jgi:NTE family protein|nr:patatin-like phospholipase family protein [Candidatus Margulisiibacteriota bacterium]
MKNPWGALLKIFKLGKEPLVGLALGGGSMRGLANVGVLKTLAKHQVPIHCIAGTSAGSIAAALWAAGKSTAEIEEIALNIDWLKIAQLSFNLRGLLSPAKLQKYMTAALGIKYFRETKVPLSISASDLLSGREYVFAKPEEEIALAVAASCSVPGVFSPISYRGHYLVDGCLTNNIPFSSLARHKPTLYLGVNVISRAPMPEPPQNMMQIISRSYDIYELTNLERYARYRPLLLDPLKEYISPAIKPGKDFYHKLIQAGEIETEKMIARIKSAAG